MSWRYEGAATAPAGGKSAQPMRTRHGGFPVLDNSYNRCASVDGELVHISGTERQVLAVRTEGANPSWTPVTRIGSPQKISRDESAEDDH
jgi:hypothetical protein